MRLGRFILWIMGLSVIWALALAFDVTPFLRGGFGWRWPYNAPQDVARLIPLLVALIVFIVGAVWLRDRRASILLLWSVSGGVLLTLAGLHVTGDPLYTLYTRTVAGGPTGWHYAAARIDDLDATLAEWPDFMRRAASFSSHLRLSPPGLVLVQYETHRVLESLPEISAVLSRPLRRAQCDNLRLMNMSNGELAGAWLGMLMPLWGALTVLPLYRLGRIVFDEKTARWAVVWWPLVPAYLIFTPTPNTFFPLIGIAGVLLLVEGLKRDRALYVLLSGVLYSALAFFNLSVLPLILLSGLYALLHGRRMSRTEQGRHVLRRMGRHAAAFGLGLASVWCLYYLAYGVTPWSIVEVMLEEHLALDRPYAPWLFLHLYDFFVFTGWPLALLAGLSMWRVLKAIRARNELSDAAAIVFALTGTLLIVDVSGALRGESGRVLLPLSPFVLLAAAYALASDQSDMPRRALWLVTAIQALMVFTLLAFLRVSDSGLSDPPATPPIQPGEDVGLVEIASDAVFGNVFRLQSFAGHIEKHTSGDDQRAATLVLWLDWLPSGYVDVPYYVSLIPVAPDGSSALQATLLQPFDQRYPTTCWSPEGGPIRDRLEAPLAEASAGDWWVSLSLVDGRSGAALDVVWADGTQDRQVGLGPFRINSK